MSKQLSDKAKFILGSIFGHGRPLKFDRRYMAEHQDIADSLEELVDAGYLLMQDDVPFPETCCRLYSVPADIDIKSFAKFSNSLIASGTPPKVRIYKRV